MTALALAIALLGTAGGCTRQTSSRDGGVHPKISLVKFKKNRALVTFEPISAAKTYCPKGTMIAGEAMEAGYILYCVAPDRVPHGPFVRWGDDGKEAERGHFERGRRGP